MYRLLIFLSLVACSGSVKEKFEDLEGLIDDPKLLASLEKRLDKFLKNEAESASQDDGCYSMSGIIDETCSFQTKQSQIIKTTESLENGAFFLKNLANVSCAKDCTRFCCSMRDCDTSVYQDKDKRNCYLFTCGAPSKCIFTDHTGYMASSLSLETQSTHTYGGEGATASHEDDLSNLSGSGGILPQEPPQTNPPTTAAPTTTSKPGLGEDCVPWSSVCADPHAHCVEEECECGTGYQAKFGKCSKICTVKQFECVNEVDRNDHAMDCIPESYVCDGTPDCSDGSDEMNCPSDKKGYQPPILDQTNYGNKLYQPVYGQPDNSQYRYGFPIPGLTNQQPAVLQPAANPVYPANLPANGNTGQQQQQQSYYLPVLANGNKGNLNLQQQQQPQGQPQSPSQLGNPWNYKDSPLYQNGLPYQGVAQPIVPQSPYIPGLTNNQILPGQTGTAPVQNPLVQQPVLTNNLQPVQNPINGQPVNSFHPDSRPNSHYPGKDNSKDTPGDSDQRPQEPPKVTDQQKQTHPDPGASAVDETDSAQQTGNSEPSSKDSDKVNTKIDIPDKSPQIPNTDSDKSDNLPTSSKAVGDGSAEGDNSSSNDKPSESISSAIDGDTSSDTESGSDSDTQKSPSLTPQPKGKDQSDSSSQSGPKESGGLIGGNMSSIEVITNSTQGPIIALALGLAITLFLLIFVGCRLRNVKKRLRKGRALHSNEADYLINGMYL